jgi:hypothetical protein
MSDCVASKICNLVERESILLAERYERLKDKVDNAIQVLSREGMESVAPDSIVIQSALLILKEALA